jgi:hypothetical protein
MSGYSRHVKHWQNDCVELGRQSVGVTAIFTHFIKEPIAKRSKDVLHHEIDQLVDARRRQAGTM